MRKVAIALVIGGAIVMVLLSQFGLREQNLARGELYEALVASPEDANALTAVFARFVPTEADLEEQAPVLEANGFRCDIVPASVAGSRYLTCVRPIEGSGFCRGLQFYSYQSGAGDIIEVLGSAYNSERDRGFLGSCDDSRQRFYATGEVSSED
jgi:hypothetical protein